MTGELLLATALFAVSTVVPFKDAAKIKSWDAWHDHEKQESSASILGKERWCVTWEKLNKLDFGLKEIGRLAVRTSDEIAGSKWSVGCETMDRDYAEWDSYKELLSMLGVKHARFFSGWAKTEQEKGVYDFTWLDPHIRECAAMGIRPWVCISYGNPVWGSDFRLGMRVKQVTDNPEAFAAWLRYTKALVARYGDVVDEWEVWNEPFGQAQEYAELFFRTAKAIREVQPEAKVFCTAISWNANEPEKSDYAAVLERLKRENALDLGSYFIYHPYLAHPEEAYKWLAEPLRKFVKGYSGKFDIMQGEVGCPAQLEFAHALAEIEWTEYSQAKWDLRRAIGDAVRNIPSSVFTMIDLQYTYMLQSFGLVRSNALKEFVYRRPKWYAMRNVYSLFDDEALPTGVAEDLPAEITRRADPRETGARTLTRASFARFGQTLHLFWYSDKRPSNSLEFDRVTLRVPGGLRNPVWVDMITGRIGEIDPRDVRQEGGETVLTNLPMWDSPVLVANRTVVPFAIDWKKATPFEIVDAIYRPSQCGHRMKAFPGPHTNEAWRTMKTDEFLPCFDRYGQFRHRNWPGKTLSDEDLKKAREAEDADLAAHPGPTDRNRFGGWKNGPKLKATGRFRVEKVDGKWWFVDPEGRLYWSFGPVRVSASSGMTPMNGDTTTPRIGVGRPDRDCLFAELPPDPAAADATPLSKFWTTHDDLLWPFYLARGETRVYDFSSANLFRKYGENYYETFSDLVHRRLRSWGCNTVANSSDLKICLMDRTPYAERVETQSRPIAGSWGQWGKFRDPWDASFGPGIAAALEAHDREAHDPWCIGFFIDNEIQWGGKETDLAQWSLQSPADQPAKVACVAYLKAKYGEIGALNAVWNAQYANWEDLLHSVAVPGPNAAADLGAFTRVIVEEYFKRTREAVKAFDPGLLYLGCRFAGCPGWVIGPCARYCDVVSYNIYRETLDGWKLPKGLDAPVLCGEFHFGATDRGPFGTGVCVARDQNDRAEKMKAYVRSALAHPQMVGVHWHQFSDQPASGRFDGEYLQVGWTDICDTPYPIMRAALRDVGYSLYEARGSTVASASVLHFEDGDALVPRIERALAERLGGETLEVVLGDGVYEMTRGLALVATNVTIRAEHPGKATIIGGRAFRGRDFSKELAKDVRIAGRLTGEARKHVVALRVPMTLRAFFEAGRHTGGALWHYPDFNRYNMGQNVPTYPCLTIGGRRMEPARWPNAGYFWPGTNDTVRMPNAKEKSVLVRARGSRMSAWRCKTDNVAAAGWIDGCTYLDCCCPVTDYVKASNAVEVASANFNTDSSRLYFFNILEELDAPGEWCYNRETGTLVLYPPEDFADDSLCAVGFVREPLFHVTGSRVSVLDIDFTAKVGHPTVVIEQGTDNLVRGCTFGGIGYNGIVMMGRRNAVRDCDFRDVVCSAVHVLGGVEKTMERGENLVDNCRVTNYAILGTSWAMGGIYLDGVGNTVSHCEVSDGPETGLYLAGIGNTIEYCRVWDVVKQFDDVGLVYVPGGARCYGNVFRYNDLSGRPGEVVGIYFDDTSSGSTAYGNVVRDCARGALIGGGRDNIISNNVFVSCFTGIQIDNRGLEWKSYTSTPDAEHRARHRKRLDLTNSACRIAATYPKLVTWLDDTVPLRSYADNVFANNLILDPHGFDSSAKFAKGRTIPADRLVYTNNLCVRTRGPQGPYDPIRHPELLPTNEYSKIAYLISKPIGTTRLVDGTAEEPVDLGFVDVPESRFDPWPYYMRYVHQAWIDMPKLFEFRRAGTDKSMGMKPYRVGDFNLKPDARLKELMPQFKPIPWDKIGLSADMMQEAFY